ncbi:MAG: PDZ domain-containing protein [Planctomycetes bacterium]|nr:PDZ domain-containing protein [Planctomycetota bacterium]
MLIRALGILSLLAPAGLCSIGPTPAGPAAAAVVAAPGGYLGIRASENNGGQVVVDEILAESPAEKSGLKSGDIVVAIDETAIGSVDELLQALAAKNAGDRVTVKLKRGTETISAVVNLAQRPATLANPDTTDAPPLAPTARAPMRQSPSAPVGEGSSEQRGWLGVYYDDVPGGVKISSVVDGSPAQAAGLAANDVVTGAGKAVITSSSDLISVLEDLRAGDAVTFTVLRGNDVMDVAVTLGARVDAAMTQPAAPAVPSIERTPVAPEVDEPSVGQNAPAGRMNRARRAVGRVAQAQRTDVGPGLKLAPGQEMTIRAITNADGTTGIEVVSGKAVHSIKVPKKGTRGFSVERDGDGFVLRLSNMPTVAPLRVRVDGGAGGMTPAEPAPSDEPPAMGGGGMAMESDGATLFAPAEAFEANAFGDMRIATMAAAAQEIEDAADTDDLEVVELAELAELGDLGAIDAGDGTNAIVISGGPASTTWFATTDDGATTVTPASEADDFFTVTESDGEFSMFVTQSAGEGDDGPAVEKAKASIGKGSKAARGLRIEANPKAKQAIEKARKAAKARRGDSAKQPAKRAFAFRGPAGGEWRGTIVPGGPGGLAAVPGGMRWRAMRVPFGGKGPRAAEPPKVIQRANDGSIAVPGYRIAPPHAAAPEAHRPGPHPRVIIDGDRILIFDRGHGDHGPGAQPQPHDVVIERSAATSECCAGGECCPGGECCEDGACCEPDAKHEHLADVK